MIFMKTTLNRDPWGRDWALPPSWFVYILRIEQRVFLVLMPRRPPSSSVVRICFRGWVAQGGTDAGGEWRRRSHVLVVHIGHGRRGKEVRFTDDHATVVLQDEVRFVL